MTTIMLNFVAALANITIGTAFDFHSCLIVGGMNAACVIIDVSDWFRKRGAIQ